MSATPTPVIARAPRIWPWFLAALAAMLIFFNPWTARHLPVFPIRPPWLGTYLFLAGINLALAAVMGVLTRPSVGKRLLVVLLAAALPILFYFFMLMFGCPLVDTIMHRYICGL